jgi:predicted PurR-regulated permease PerM
MSADHATVEEERIAPGSKGPAKMRTDSANRLYRFTFVFLLMIAISAAFLFLIRAFILDIFLAAIFAGLLHPLFEKMLPAFGGRRGLAAAVMVVAAVLALALPLGAIIMIVGSEALQLSDTTVAWIQRMADNPQLLLGLLPRWAAESKWLPMVISSATAHVADIINAVAGFLSRELSSATLGAVQFLFDIFVTSFAIVCFLRSGPALVQRVTERIPVAKSEAHLIVDKTLQVTAATLKSIVIVGAAQAILIGTGFAVAGIGQPVFWGTIAGFASNVPGLGSGLVWAPAAIYLIFTGHVFAGVGLGLWGMARGGALPGFLVFISTLGGLAVLGPAGLLIGPVLAGILTGVLDLYYSVLKSSGLLNSSE